MDMGQAWGDRGRNPGIIGVRSLWAAGGGTPKGAEGVPTLYPLLARDGYSYTFAKGKHTKAGTTN